MQHGKKIHVYEIRKQHFMSNHDAFRTLLKSSSSAMQILRMTVLITLLSIMLNFPPKLRVYFHINVVFLNIRVFISS